MGDAGADGAGVYEVEGGVVVFEAFCELGWVGGAGWVSGVGG